MGHRWFNVDVEYADDGSVEIHFEGRGEFPLSETVELEQGESARVHGELEIGDSLRDQPSEVDWYISGPGD